MLYGCSTPCVCQRRVVTQGGYGLRKSGPRPPRFESLFYMQSRAVALVPRDSSRHF